ncbi:ATP-binding protein [Streptomyces sp. NA02950]|uniref:ATP-binding protein n=1 Tax=Streptomyces sp. NA02950 TaxID=2742137 RepID=UPI0015927A6B|nr:ATP-binding protein [Streptomyces sp. NA02950]QKV93522.1 ATP-binding protein [Streptomyces sp. NA02950]
MMIKRCMSRKAWDLPFLAVPGEVAALRRIVRTHLKLWGLSDLVGAAQICVTELVANVIRHVGVGTPTTLALVMNGTDLRIEVHDPDRSALPTLLNVPKTAESGRGLTLVTAVSDRWGVIPTETGKTTWCELGTDLSHTDGHVASPQVHRADAVLTLYDQAGASAAATRRELVGAEEAAITLIADLLHWFHAHGQDPDTALDRAQMYFESRGNAVG